MQLQGVHTPAASKQATAGCVLAAGLLALKAVSIHDARLHVTCASSCLTTYTPAPAAAPEHVLPPAPSAAAQRSWAAAPSPQPEGVVGGHAGGGREAYQDVIRSELFWRAAGAWQSKGQADVNGRAFGRWCADRKVPYRAAVAHQLGETVPVRGYRRSVNVSM